MIHKKTGYKKFKKKELEKEVVMDLYLKLSDVVAANLGNEKKAANYKKVQDGMDKMFSNLASCEDLLAVFQPRFDAAPEDVYTFNVQGIGDVPICSSATMSLPYTESFESGTNGWNSGGADASRENATNYSYDNNYSFRIRNGAGSASSFCSPNVDISSYDKVDFKFFFYADGFELDETFTFEYSDDDGASWIIVRTFNAGDTSPSEKSGDFQSFQWIIEWFLLVAVASSNPYLKKI